MHLGCRCRRLCYLRLAATGGDTISRRRGDDGRIFFNRQRFVDVAGLYRADVRGLLAVETGVLIRPDK